MNKQHIILIVVVSLLILLGVFFYLSIREDSNEITIPQSDIESARNIARNFIETASPTYLYDGLNLELFEEDVIGEGTYRFTYVFQTNHAGYGNREGQILTQAKVDHLMIIEVREGKIAAAITDGQYDEIIGELLFDPDSYQKG